MLNKIKKLLLCLMMLCATLLTVNANDTNDDELLYYQTFTYQKADEYVQNNVGDFLSSEIKITNFNINDVKIGKGIYVDDFNNEGLPIFYYPVFISNRLRYVFRIYDDGTGNYTGAFGENLVDEVLKNASNDAEHAKLWGVCNGNEFVLSKTGDYDIVRKSQFGDKLDSELISNHNKKRSKDILKSSNVANNNMNFVKYPSSRAYWVYNISYVENQNEEHWCYGFVTTMAIRTMKGNSVRTNTMAATYGLSTQQGFDLGHIIDFCSRYGIKYTAYYNATTTATTVYNEVSKWNLMAGIYESSSAASMHALLLHGVDGSKVRIWNPWYTKSEWITNIKSYYAGHNWSMYGYGFYRS